MQETTFRTIAEANADSGGTIRLMSAGDQPADMQYQVVIFDQLGQPDPSGWGSLDEGLWLFSKAVRFKEHNPA